MKLSKRVLNSIGGMIGITIISQMISFIRESIFAYFYGATIETDAYVLSSQIPIILFAVVAVAINTVLLPIYTEKKEHEGLESANCFLKSFVLIYIPISLIFTIFVEIYPNLIVKIFAPYFSGELLNLTILYLRIMFPTVILTGVISIITVVYNAENQFIFPTIVSLFQNIAIIFSIVLFGREYGALAAVWGTVLGIVVNLMVLFIFKISIFNVKSNIRKTYGYLKIAFQRVIPITIGVGISEINRIIDRSIASGLQTGSITALNYANKLTTVFSSLILSAISTVAFKKFSEFTSTNNKSKKIYYLNQYLSILIIFLLPLTIGAIILKKEIITLAFGRGAYTGNAINQTIEVFQYYCIGIVFIAIREILSKYFYSTGDTKTPMINGAYSVVINCILNILLVMIMGASGLALATTISTISACLFMINSCYKKEKNFSLKKLKNNFKVIIVSSFIMMIFLILFNSVFVIYNIYLKFLLNIILGVTIYLLGLIFLNKNMLSDLFSILLQNFYAE